MKTEKIVLASASPRRLELLHMLGFSELTVCPAQGEEKPPVDASPEEIVKALSLQKAAEVFSRQGDDALVIAADTIVWLDGKLLGKPHSEEEAFAMLRRLSGKSHEVYTGVSVIDAKGTLCETERSTVHFRVISDEEIRRYIATGEPMDKAGAYGAQGKGALFVRMIEGDFFNVMGLPLCLLGQMLLKKGVTVL